MNGTKLIYTILAGLAVLGIAGGIHLAIAQGKTETRVDAVEGVQEYQQETVQSVPVIVNEITHIKESIDDIEEKQDEILRAVQALK